MIRKFAALLMLLVLVLGTGANAQQSVIFTPTLAPTSEINSTLCYENVEHGCEKIFGDRHMTGCNAAWGAFTRPEIVKGTIDLISTKIYHSFEYMFQATYFKQWDINRPGFHAYFDKLSDDEWASATDLLIHMVKRGGKLNDNFKIKKPTVDFQRNEMKSLSWALDREKETVKQASHLAYDANHGKDKVTARDEAFTNFIAEKINEESVLRIKHLSNYIHILGDIIMSSVEKTYAFFVFDHEILK